MDLRYAYANARVKAMKSRLLSESVVKEMLAVQSVSEVVELLEEDPVYKPFLVKNSERFKGVELVSRALQESLVSTIKKMYGFAPASSKDEFKLLFAELELNDLKTIIAKKALGLPVDKTELYNAWPENSRLVEEMIAAKDCAAALAALRKSEYAVAFPQKLVCQLDKTADFRMMASALSDYHHEFVERVIEGQGDASVSKILRDKIDCDNIALALRLKKTGLAISEIPPRLKKPVSARVKRVAEAVDYDAAVAVVEKETRIKFSPEDRKTISRIEVQLEKRFVEKAVRDFRLSVMSFGAIIGYYYLKLVEVENIRKIAFATHFGVKEELKDAVFAVNA